VSVDAELYLPIRLIFDGISITLGMSWDPPVAGDVPGLMTGARVNISRVLLNMRPCLHGAMLYGCWVLGVGALEAGGEGIALPEQEISPNYVVTGGRLGVQMPVTS
jgi:hypothetical protein